MNVFSKNKQKKQDACHDYLTTVNALKDKEVVSVCDGRRLGYVCDLAIDLKSGRILSLIIPGDLKYFGFKREESCVIPWCAITRIGDDIILVNPSQIQQGSGFQL
ncbi:MAG: YlmC/YmxH family sporulation protein [Clostridia bacterium]|nr:YlmC/YmxH family sporulation protein [Clostridia bacterium]